MANQFYVEPADIMPGLQSAMSGFRSFADAKSETKKTEQTQAKRDEFVSIIESGDGDKIREAARKNPELAKEVHGADESRWGIVKQRRAEMAIEGLSGLKTYFQAAVDYTEKSQQDGVDSTQGLALSELAIKEPEKARKAFEVALSLYGTDEQWSNYRESQGLGGAGGKPTKQKTGAFLVRHPGTNEQMIAVGSYDTSTGTLQTETAGLGEGWEVLSKMGETGQEESVRKVEQKRGETTVTGEEARASDLITRGIASAESSATIRRALDLLDTVETGGIDNANLAAKRFFGVEGADEGELSGALGKAVLSQLRETFGAAFTQEEGNRLIRIEAGFGKSPATNKRLLKQSLRIAERTAQRARKAAVKRKDQATVDDIDDLMSFSLSVEGTQAQPSVQTQQTLPAGVTEEDITATMQLRGMTREQVLTKLGVR